MAEDNYNAFDYYNAEPPKEGATLPPEFTASAPEDEYNEKVHGTDQVKRASASVRSIALALAVSGLAASFVVSAGGFIPYAGFAPDAGIVTETGVSGNGDGKPSESVTETSAKPTPVPTPKPTPTPVPLPTEDLRVRFDSFKVYPIENGFLGEIRFSLLTNCGINISSISGSADSRMFIYDGYNVKKRKMKYHYENLHKEFSLDTDKVVTGAGPELSEKQYVLYVELPKLSSEDKMSVTLKVSNTLNGKATEDKEVTLKDIATWNEKTDSYSNSMINIAAKKNADKTYSITVTSNDGIPVSNAKISSVYASGKTKYVTNKGFKVSYDGDNITVAFKNPKKAPAKGTISFTVLADYVLTDSNGKTYSGRSYGYKSLKY